MTNEPSYSLIDRDPDTWNRIVEILELPESMQVSDIKVTFGNDLVGRVALEIFPTGEQVVALAEIARQPK